MTEPERRSRRDIYAGGIFLAIAALFAIQGLRYDFGTALQMGPGFFPVVLALVLAIFGILILLSGLRSTPQPVEGEIPWKAIALICLALTIFGAGARLFGLVPVVLISTFLTAIASRKNSLLSSAVMAVVMAALCYVIFKIGLAVTLPTFGPVFGR